MSSLHFLLSFVVVGFRVSQPHVQMSILIHFLRLLVFTSYSYEFQSFLFIDGKWAGLVPASKAGVELVNLELFMKLCFKFIEEYLLSAGLF